MHISTEVLEVTRAQCQKVIELLEVVHDLLHCPSHERAAFLRSLNMPSPEKDGDQSLLNMSTFHAIAGRVEKGVQSLRLLRD